MKFGKKGLGVGDIAPIAIALVIAIITVGIGAQVLGNIGATFSAGTPTRMVIENGTAGLNQLASYFPIIGLVVAAAIIIGVVFQSFMRP